MNGWSVWWLCWFSVSFLAFIGPEVYTLATDSSHTLSANVWKLEQLSPGETIAQWHAAHVLIGGVLALCLVWLIFHLVFGIWR